MKKFLLKFFIFLIPVPLLFGVAYELGYYPLITNSVSFDAKLIEIKKIKLKQVDIAAIGSSICLNNFNSEVLRDSLKQSYYNFGAWGLQAEDLNHLIKSYVSEYKPKYVLFPSSFADFDNPENGTLPHNLYYSKYLMPIYYVKNYSSFAEISARKDQITSSKNLDNYVNLHFDENGGIALNISKKNTDSARLFIINNLLAIFPSKYTSASYRGLDSLALFLQQQKIKLIFIQFPYADYYIKSRQKQAAIYSHFNTCKTIVEKHGGVYLNMEQTNEYPDSLFADPLHFNAMGSAFVTKKIAHKLKAIINSKPTN